MRTGSLRLVPTLLLGAGCTFAEDEHRWDDQLVADGPCWRVDLSDAAETHVYVDARTGEVTARRNGTWRIYDFLWGLHIMDYREHDDFRHPLLVAAAGLAVVTALSGLLLWAMRLVRRWRRWGAGPDLLRARRRDRSIVRVRARRVLRVPR